MFQKKIRVPMWAKVILALIAGVVITWYYCRMFSFLGIDSDYSNLLLEAKDIVHGNVFLNGWTQTGISFLTTDLLYYMVAVLMNGVKQESYWLASSLMTVCVLYSAIPLVGMGGKRTHKSTEWVLFLGLCLFPSTVGLNLLRAHTGVYVWVFIAIACFYKMYVERSKRKLYYALFVVSVVLGCIGDAIIYIVLLLPLFLICARDWLSNQPVKKKENLLVMGEHDWSGGACGYV